MNLYKVSQNVNRDRNYFDSMVVAAPDVETARRMSPNGGIFYKLIDDVWNFKYTHKPPEPETHSGWAEIKDVEVELIGRAVGCNEQQLIVVSYNAG